MPNRLVFIDSAVENAQSLAASVLDGTQVVMIDSNADGVDQISTVLAGYQNLTSIHILSHASINSLALGRATLDLGTISGYSDKLRSWSTALSIDGDILLYGCNIADGDTSLITALSDLTGADVAASTDVTGSANRGGNWILETSTSTIEATLPFNSSLLDQYIGVLATGNGLSGEYFDNMNFTNRIATRTDATVDFNWGGGSPVTGMGADTFSVRWSGQVLAPTSGTYTFFTTTDDGVRLRVNGQLVIDRFVDQWPIEHTGAITLQAGQRYDIEMEYFENGGGAMAQLGWSGPGVTRQIIPQSQLFSSTSTTPPTTPPPTLPPTPPTTPSSGNGLRGEYFDNMNFTNRIATRTDATVDFNWGGGSPVTGMGADTFSVRWSGQVLAPTSGTYTFFTTTDDGVRLRVNGQLVIDRFVDQWPIEHTGAITLQAGQRYDIEMEYFENGGGAMAQLGWSGPGVTRQIIPQSQLFSSTSTTPPTTPPPTLPPTPPTTPSSGNGLRGEYFDNMNLTNSFLTRTDATVDFNWGAGSPVTGMGADTFSVRWSGQVQPLYSDTYTFFTTTDDGVRLRVNGQLVIDRFVDQWAIEHNGTIALQAGQRYNIEMEYFENGGGAVAQLGWFSANQIRQIIPQSQLYSTTTNPGTIVVGTNEVTVSENAGTATVRVDRVDGSDGVVTVRYTTIEGSARAGSDFTDTVGQLVFADGETSKTFTIPIINDGIQEDIKSFGFGLFNVEGPPGVGLGINRTASITILDDDALPSYSFSSAVYNVDENAGTATITVYRNGQTSGTGSIRYATSDDSAGAGSDYTATSGTLTFAPGENIKSFTIPIIDDNISELSETLTLTLSAPVGGRLGSQSAAELLIADNDYFGNLNRQTVLSGVDQPTAIDWTPGGEYMLIAQKDGVVRVARNGVLQQTPAVDISDMVNSTRDRGLIGFTVHPEFFNGTPYVYLAYTYDPPETANASGLAGRDGVGNRAARVGRFTATIDNGVLTIDRNSEVVILGRNSVWENISRPDVNSTIDVSIPESGKDANGNYIQDFLIIDSETHSVGSVRFGADGYLYVSNGDGASYNLPDPRAVRVLSLDNLSGKILRIDPITGAAPSDNPFYNGDPQSNQSKVWQLGLRNPFRFTISPINGQLYIGDVGWGSWEEVNTGGPGANFGWTVYEGPERASGYGDFPSIQSFVANGGLSRLTEPLYAYRHFYTGTGNAINVGDFYRGELFITDMGKGTVDALSFDSSGNLMRDPAGNAVMRRIAEDMFGLTHIRSGPDGNLYYVSLVSGEVGRWIPV